MANGKNPDKLPTPTEIIEKLKPPAEYLPPSPTEIIEKLKIKPPPSKIITPDVLQTIILDEIAGRLADLGEIMEKVKNQMEIIPEGLIYPVERTIDGVGIVKLEITKEPECGEKPWYSCTIYNDGDSDLYVSLNFAHKKYQKVKSGEALDLDMHAPLIRTLYFKSVVEGSCDIRVVGER